MSAIQNDWESAFEAYNQLPREIRLALRHNCADLMEQEGCEEIGSSDVNHRLFALYNENSQSWQAVIAFFLDFLDHN
ncbi:MAG: hypothetical protein EBR30_01050 [Cytophagia bacterium]|nr:hypothetical protein [Cytophagia bacterium]